MFGFALCQAPAISLMDSSLETIAFILESARAPTAMVTERTVGIATGIEATIRIRENCTSSKNGLPRSNWTKISIATKPRSPSDLA